MEVNQHFALRLKELREKEKLSQSHLAERLGVSRGSISFYENEERIPDIVFLSKVSKEFNVNVDYLLGYTNIKSNDIDMKTISNKTGLSAEAVETLCEAKDNYDDGKYDGQDMTTSVWDVYLKFINILIEDFPGSFALSRTYYDYYCTLEKMGGRDVSNTKTTTAAAAMRRFLIESQCREDDFSIVDNHDLAEMNLYKLVKKMREAIENKTDRLVRLDKLYKGMFLDHTEEGDINAEGK